MTELRDDYCAKVSAGRSERLDAFRGVAIIMVMVLHAGMLMPDSTQLGWGFPLLSRMSTGVQLFFVLSGYLIASSWDRLRSQPFAVQRFYLHRAAKIAPLYFVGILLNVSIYYVCKYLFPDFNASARNFLSDANLTVENFVIHFTFTVGGSPAYIHTLLDGVWSIICEVYFYVIFPVAAYAIFKLNRAFGFAVVLLTCSMLFFTYFEEINSAVKCYYGSNKPGYRYYHFFSQIPCFFIGVFSYLFDRSMSSDFIGRSASVKIMIFSAFMFLGMVNGTNYPLHYHYMYAMLFALILVCSRPLPFAHSIFVVPVLRFFGRQTYALFIVHMPVMRISSYVLQHEFELSSGWLFFVCNAVLGFYISICISHFALHPLDEFFVRLGKRFEFQKLAA